MTDSIRLEEKYRRLFFEPDENSKKLFKLICDEDLSSLDDFLRDEESSLSSFINKKNKLGQTPLLYALSLKKIDHARALMKAGAALWISDNKDCNLLHYMASIRFSKIKSFLEKVSTNYDCKIVDTINQKNKEGQTPLDMAMISGLLELSRNLVAKGADAFIHDGQCKTKLGSMKGEQVLKLLLQDLQKDDELARECLISWVKYMTPSNLKKALSVYTQLGFSLWVRHFDNRYQEKGDTVLHVAAQKRDPAVLKVLLEQDDLQGLTIETLGQKDLTVLMSAIRGKKIENVKYLLSLGANTQVTDEAGRNILHIAAWFFDLDIMKILLKRPDTVKMINVKDRWGYTPLTNAVVSLPDRKGAYSYWKDERDDVERLAARSDIDWRSLYHIRYKNPDIFFRMFFKKMKAAVGIDEDVRVLDKEWIEAIQREDTQAIPRLIQEADPTLKDKEGKTVLHLAVAKRNLKLLTMLLENEDIRLLINEGDNFGETPLICGLKDFSKDDPILVALIQNGADRCARNFVGDSALHIAAETCDPGVLASLLMEGPIAFDINKENFSGMTPLAWAIKADKVANMQILLNHDAAVFFPCKYGTTVLHIAVQYANESTLQVLLKALAVLLKEKRAWVNLEQGDFFGMTALMKAVKLNKAKQVETLLNAGADRTVRDCCQNTLLHMAASHYSTDILKRLLEYDDVKELLDEKNIYQQTPLTLALTDGNQDCADILMEQSNIDYMDLFQIGWKNPSQFFKLWHKKFNTVYDDEADSVTSDQIVSGEVDYTENGENPSNNDEVNSQLLLHNKR